MFLEHQIGMISEGSCDTFAIIEINYIKTLTIYNINIEFLNYNNILIIFHNVIVFTVYALVDKCIHKYMKSSDTKASKYVWRFSLK